MARKPTRFWHPARRLLTRAQERVRSVVARDDAPPSLEDVRPRLQHYLRAMYGESVMIESLAPPKEAGWPVRALRALALVKERGRSESDAERIRLPATLPGQRANVSSLEQYRVIAVQHAERMRRASALHARDVSAESSRPARFSRTLPRRAGVAPSSRARGRSAAPWCPTAAAGSRGARRRSHS